MSNESLMEIVNHYISGCISAVEMLKGIINNMDNVVLNGNIVDLRKEFSFEIIIGKNIWTVMGMSAHDPISIDGDCSDDNKRIRIILRDEPYCENILREIVRHELIHAFVYETGMAENKMDLKDGWTQNEVMVEWFTKHMDEIYASENEIMENISRILKELKTL